MPCIFDNTTRKTLYEVLRKSLGAGSRADFCTGYFNIHAWNKISSKIEKFSGGETACCRLLVGMKEGASSVVNDALEKRDPRCLERLREQIQDKKVFIKCGGENLVHAKLYLIHSNSFDNLSLCILGSSNLTVPGIATQIELNVAFLEHDVCNEYQAWFNRQWDERDDISDAVIQRIDKHLNLIQFPKY